jgi:hypothetical protein
MMTPRPIQQLMLSVPVRSAPLLVRVWLAGLMMGGESGRGFTNKSTQESDHDRQDERAPVGENDPDAP